MSKGRKAVINRTQIDIIDLRCQQFVEIFRHVTEGTKAATPNVGSDHPLA